MNLLQKHGKIDYFNSMPKVSYVCPVYNKIKYLPHVLDSIYNQKGTFEKEYIFINDGSNDNSLEFLKKYTKNKKNTKILSQKNKGPACATQNGIKHSKGNYVKLVGGDDIMSPNCTEALLEVITKTSSVGVFSKYKEFNKFGDIIFKEKRTENIKTIHKPLKKTLQSNYSGTTPNLYCNKAIKKSGGCYDNLFVEDFSLVLRLSLFGSFSFIDNISSFGPADDKNRIMLGKKNQLLHDYNAAIYLFLTEHPNLSSKLKSIACIKCLGRSEKWLRRELKKSFINEMNYLRIKYFITKTNEKEFIKKACEVFYKFSSSNPIRYQIC